MKYYNSEIDQTEKEISKDLPKNNWCSVKAPTMDAFMLLTSS